MRVTLLTIGSRGDVQPFVALGMGLEKAGHQVRLAAPPGFEEFVTRYHLEYHPLGENIEALLKNDKVRQTLQSGNILKFLWFRIRHNRQLLARLNDDAWQACQGAEVILYKIAVPVGYSIAQKLEVPSFEVAFQPFAPTRAFASSVLGSKSHGPLYNRLSHVLVEKILWLLSRRSLNRYRQQQLGLPALKGFWRPRELPTLYPYSSTVLPAPADWPANIHCLGYWFLETEAGWQPPQTLVDFLAAGPAPVYLGFGSMANRNPRATIDLMLKALDLAKQRGVIVSGWSDLEQQKRLPPHVLCLKSVPHDWLFPQMAAVVHHGGAGSTAAGLKAGVPSIIVPHNIDQPFWGRCIAEAGAGPAPIMRKALTAENLAAAINTAVTDTRMRERARAIGEQIRAEDGVARTIALIQEQVANAAVSQAETIGV